MTTLSAFKTLCQQIQKHDALHVESPSSVPRRACVAAIFRCHPAAPVAYSPVTSIDEFFEQPWVQHAEPELLYIQRAVRQGDRWSGQVAFPGGKDEPGETDMDTVIRETKEEIGLDLGSDAFLPLGKLDERCVTSISGKLLMVLVPFVFLQVVPTTPALVVQASEVAATQWVPLSFFLAIDPFPFTAVPVPPVPTQSDDDRLRPVSQILAGTMEFPAIVLPTDDAESTMHLWGMTLGMTRELLEHTKALGVKSTISASRL